LIEIGQERPKSKEHFTRLLAFYSEINVVCTGLGIEPVLTGSLAVFAYTRDGEMEVHDIDLACSEQEFPRLGRALETKGIAHEIMPWHVLQARRDDLKVEFDSMEHWMAGLPQGYDTLVIGGLSFNVVGLASLQELYRRGLEATAGNEGEQAKHQTLKIKYEALCTV
jgi:hypothetical protein